MNYAYSDITTRKAFTLTELLVVVLVVAILAAVGLPQYRSAVDKSRYATLMPSVKSIKDAEESFYMTSAQYSSDFQSLDIKLPGNITENQVELPGGEILNLNIDGSYDYVRGGRNDIDNAYIQYFALSRNYPGETHCEALTENSRAQKLCKNLGGREIGVREAYTVYVLSGEGLGQQPAPPGKQVIKTKPCGIDCKWIYYNDGSSEIMQYNADGSVESQTIFDESGNRKESLRYRADGSLSEQIIFKDGVLSDWKLYDSSGALTRERIYDPTTGKQLSETGYSLNGTVYVHANYNPQTGKMTDSTSYDSDGNVSARTNYDPQTGKTLDSTNYNYEGGAVHQRWIYNPETGQLLTQTSYHPDGTVSSRSNYDPETGRLVEGFSYDYGNNANSSEKYDPQTGKPINKTNYNKDGSISSIYNYNSQTGKMTDSTSFNTDGSIAGYNTYDSTGCQSSTVYNPDGSIKRYNCFAGPCKEPGYIPPSADTLPSMDSYQRPPTADTWPSTDTIPPASSYPSLCQVYPNQAQCKK